MHFGNFEGQAFKLQIHKQHVRRRHRPTGERFVADDHPFVFKPIFSGLVGLYVSTVPERILYKLGVMAYGC